MISLVQVMQTDNFKAEPTLKPPRDLPGTVLGTDLPMHLSGAVAVFRGLDTGVFEDWYVVLPSKTITNCTGPTGSAVHLWC